MYYLYKQIYWQIQVTASDGAVDNLPKSRYKLVFTDPVKPDQTLLHSGKHLKVVGVL